MFVVAQEGKVGAQANPKGISALRRIGTDHGEVTIVDPQFILQFHKVPYLARAFGSPVPPVETQDERKAFGEFGEPDGLLAMVWQDEAREVLANDELGIHRRPLDNTRC